MCSYSLLVTTLWYAAFLEAWDSLKTDQAARKGTYPTSHADRNRCFYFKTQRIIHLDRWSRTGRVYAVDGPSETQISPPNFVHTCDFPRLAFDMHPAFGKDIGVVAQSQSQVDVLLHQHNR